MNYRCRFPFVLSAATFACVSSAQIVPLGSAANFAILGGSTVTNTGNTVITGDLGVSPGTAITGFPPGQVIGTTHAGDAIAAQAHADSSTAYNDMVGLASTQNLTGSDLGGLTLTPGVYTFDSSAQLTGTLTLNFTGDPTGVFVFQIGSTLTTASDSAVVDMGGGSDGNVFWQVGSSATLGTGTAFEGTAIAEASITLDTGASILDGRAIALTGAVTLDDNAITNPAAVPEPAPTAAMLLGLGTLLIRRRRGAPASGIGLVQPPIS